jgi:hypothetical protein
MKTDEVYINTLKMMGVKGLALVEFKDALSLYPLTINQEVKQGMINKILGTVVMEKTLKQWFEFFVKEGNKSGISYCFLNEDNQPINRPYRMQDFDFSRIEKPNVKILIELILEEYYKKELV